MVYKFPYTRVSNINAPDLAKFKFHPLIKIGLLNDAAFFKTEAYIDTGSQWCLFNSAIASQVGIKDYKDTENQLTIFGVGGKESANIGYFHNVKLAVFKNTKDISLKNAWKINTVIGFLDRPFGFSGILGVRGFLDQFIFKTNIPEGYFELDPIYDLDE